MIKRVIDGKAYNTETATFLWGNGDPNDPPDIAEGMYQTKHGAFFLVQEHLALEYANIKPMLDPEAQKWLEDHGADLDVMERAFGAFPEAGAAELRTTLRLPAALYQRVVAAANAEDVSLNTYIMRLLERSLSRTASQERAS
jgi:predicted HicB family RNase H-like nuclease